MEPSKPNRVSPEPSKPDRVTPSKQIILPPSKYDLYPKSYNPQALIKSEDNSIIIEKPFLKENPKKK